MQEEASSAACKVSVIIPVYNVGEYLGQCLDSVIAQTLREIEVICVDDGSTDGSASILRSYAQEDPRIAVVTQDNHGLGNARNRGMSRAAGEYLLFLDSDDFIEPCLLEKAYGKAADTDADIVLFKADQLVEDTGEYRRLPWVTVAKYLPRAEVFAPSDCRQHIFEASTTVAWNKLYRRAHVEAHGVKFQEIGGMEDVGFVYASILTARRIALVDEVLLHYRKRKGSITDDRSTFWQYVYDSNLYVRDALAACGVYDEYELEYDRFANWSILHYYEQAKGYQKARMHKECREKWLLDFGIEEHGAEAFYDEESYRKAREIIETSVFDDSLEDLTADQERLEKANAKLKKTEKLLKQKRAAEARAEKRVEKIRSSRSYRIGRFLAHPIATLSGRAGTASEGGEGDVTPA